MNNQLRGSWLSYTLFLSTLAVILLSLVSVIFPALIITAASSYKSSLDAFEIGPLAVPLLVSNFVLFGVGFAYYKKKFPSGVARPIEFILNFEISARTTLIIVAILISIYIGFSIDELGINEEEQWFDYIILKEALEAWPLGESENLYVKEQNDRYVRMFLLSTSLEVFQNIKILPFVASILLVIATFFLTYRISQKRFAGIVSMAVLLQSYTFLKYDTVAVYENFWVLFYILSLYAVYKKWYISPISYLLSIFTKAFVVFFLPSSLFFIYRAKIARRTKIVTALSYGIAIGVSLLVFLGGDSIYGGIVHVDFSEFWIGFTTWSYQMRFDMLMILTILPLTVGLFLVSKRGIAEADSILVLFMASLLAGPVLSMFTDFYFILPYRFVPLAVFFSLGVGVFLSKRPS